MPAFHESLDHESAQPALVEVMNVVKVYSTAAGEFTALKGINMRIGKGEFVGVVGKSGAGKSTLLNMITGVDHLTAGQVIVNTNGAAISIHRMSEDKIADCKAKALFCFSCVTAAMRKGAPLTKYNAKPTKMRA